MHVLSDLILTQQAWLVKRVFHYAKLAGYTQYTATQHFQWEQAVEGLCKSMLALLEQNQPLSEFAPAMDFSLDPVITFGTEEARRHRARGVSLSMFFGLLKYFRRAYMDLVESQNYTPLDLSGYHSFVDRFFDHVEMGVINCWTALNVTELVSELKTENRNLVAAKIKYQAVITNLPIPVLLMSSTGTIEELNAAAAKLLGTEPLPNGHTALPYAQTPAWLRDAFSQCEASMQAVSTHSVTLSSTDGTREMLAHCVKLQCICDCYNGFIVTLADNHT